MYILGMGLVDLIKWRVPLVFSIELKLSMVTMLVAISCNASTRSYVGGVPIEPGIRY